jgi:hypothetical protein
MWVAHRSGSRITNAWLPTYLAKHRLLRLATGTPARWWRASGCFWIGAVSAAAISTYPWMSARAAVVLHAAGRPVDVPAMLPKSDA